MAYDDQEACRLLAVRLRLIREECFGEDNLCVLADLLQVSENEWRMCEDDGSVSAELLLSFIEVTRVNPLWLLDGRQPRYQRKAEVRSGDLQRKA